MVNGGIEAGPNAVLALAREGYRWRNISVRDTLDALTYPGLWRFLAQNARIAAYEVARSASPELFLRSLQRLVPALERGDLVRGGAGVRAQSMSREGRVLHDFEFVDGPRAVHVLSAPSPAATASLAIGEFVAERMLHA
jgi:L-2-hydroxyglutarate oxidase